MSTAQGWTLVLGTLTVQIALLTLVLTVQGRSLRNAIGQASGEIRTELHTEIGAVRTEQTGLASREQVQSLMVEFAELRGEIRARLANLEGGR